MKNAIRSAGLVVCSLIVACGSKEDSKVDNSVPTTLSFSKPSAQGSKLTRDQVNRFKEAFAGKPMMILPPGELIFPNKNMSKEELAAEEAKLKAEDINSYNLLKDIQKGCKNVRPTLVVDGRIPIQSATAEDIIAGDKFAAQLLGGIGGGTNCPVKVDGGYSANANVLEANHENKNYKASAGLGLRGTALSLNSKYSKLLNAKGIVVETGLSGIGVYKDTLGRVKASFKLSGTYYGISKDAKFSSNTDLLSSQVDNQKTKNEVVTSTDLTLGSDSVTVVAHSVQVQNSNTGVVENTTAEIYVNGHLMTQQDVEEIFGSENVTSLSVTENLTEKMGLK